MTARLDFAQLELHFVDQIQWRYELIRPLVLLAEGTPTQRAEETHTHPDTVRTFLRRFRQEGMLGLLPTDIEVAPRPRASGVVVRKNSLLTPLDDLPSTCDNTYEGKLLAVVEGQFGYDTTSTRAPYSIPDHRHA